jgi:predicted transcriptional regulator
LINFLKGNNMLGINVRNTKDESFADLIVDGLKTIETRESKSLHPYMGQRVAIIRTGLGKAVAIGEVTILKGFSWTNSRSIFDAHYDEHLVKKYSTFYIDESKGKYMYFLTDPVRYDTEVPVNTLGIVARKVYGLTS